MGILEGKVGLIIGIANERSYAWFIAQSLIKHGARCLFTHLPGEKNERRTRRAVEALGRATRHGLTRVRDLPQRRPTRGGLRRPCRESR